MRSTDVQKLLDGEREKQSILADRLVALMYEKAELESEIRRHHELIPQMRDHLEWVVNHCTARYSQPEWHRRKNEIQFLLNREVG
jgi:hypothetical protein